MNAVDLVNSISLNPFLDLLLEELFQKAKCANFGSLQCNETFCINVILLFSIMTVMTHLMFHFAYTSRDVRVNQETLNRSTS